MLQNQVPFDCIKKVVLIGDINVGKTSLINRFVDDTFSQQVDNTVGMAFRQKIIRVSDVVCKLQIWDTAGAERFRSIASSYYRSASGIIIVYDISNRESFKQIIHHLQQTQEAIDNLNPQQQADQPQYILIGAKSDLPSRQVNTDEGQQLAKNNQMCFIEVSSLSAKNVQLAFIILAKQMLLNFNTPQSKQQIQKQLHSNNFITPGPTKRYNCI